MFIPDACYTSYGSFRFADHPAGKIISQGETPEGKTVRSIALWRTRVGCVRGFSCADSGIGFGYVSRAGASGLPVCCAVQLSFGSITLSLRHRCRWLRPDILPWLPCKAPPPPGGRLLKHIGVAAVVYAREISGLQFTGTGRSQCTGHST